MQPVFLEPKFVERVWGVQDLRPLYDKVSEAPIGEVWLSSNDIATSEGQNLGALVASAGAALLGEKVPPAAGGRFPILVKFLFTAEKLSVQVHPDDTYGLAHEGQPGKTEMWYVLGAEPHASIALGFKDFIEPIQVKQAIYEKNLEDLLRWWPVEPKQAWFTPAGSVHAIGAGLRICEIQQNSDVTYRLWDYGRPRELHIEKSLDVLDFGPHPGPQEVQQSGCGDLLASCPYFATERHDVLERVSWSSDAERFHLLVATEGEGILYFGNQQRPLRAGQAVIIPATLGAYGLDGTPRLEILRCYVP